MPVRFTSAPEQDTYTNVKGFETVAGCSTESHCLGTSVGDTDLKVSVCVLLF